MPLSQVYESDTASEEESAPSILPTQDSKYKSVESDTASEKRARAIPSSPKITNNEPVILPPKPRVKSRIGGRKRNPKEIEDRTPTPPTSPPRKRPKQNPSPAPEKNEGQPIVNEVVFQHSGKPQLLLEDGAVSLIPQENRRALGGFSVRIQQKGKYVGQIRGGQEVRCRELLAKGWKAELRYLGHGRSEVVMRNDISE